MVDFYEDGDIDDEDDNDDGEEGRTVKNELSEQIAIDFFNSLKCYMIHGFVKVVT